MDFIYEIIGTENSLTWWQMGIRAFIIFIAAIILIRISNKRIFGRHAAFDIVLGIVLGSILSRAITGNSPFFSTIFAAAILVILHRLFGWIAWRYSKFGKLVKGSHQQLVEEGNIKWETMDSKNISALDLQEAIRLKGNTSNLNDVKSAFLERNGDISIILTAHSNEED